MTTQVIILKKISWLRSEVRWSA